MENRLAVLIAGDFRTFPQAAEYIFNHAESISSQVDYFFACWDYTCDVWNNPTIRENTKRIVTDSELTEPFINYNKNLVDHVILPIKNIPIADNTAYYQSYLGKVASILKRKYELKTNIVYDCVIEMRPDVYITSNRPVHYNDFEINLQVNYKDAQFPAATDFYYRSNSFTNDLMAERVSYDKLNNGNQFARSMSSWPCPLTNHWLLTDYSHLRRLTIRPTLFPDPIIPIRPNFPKTNLNEVPVAELHSLFTSYWNQTRNI